MSPIIVVPYRNREQHLLQFINYINNSVYRSLNICIVEQSVEKPFNRAKLLNIGYLENPAHTHYIFHDVDMLPVNVTYESYEKLSVVQLAGSDIQKRDYLGGVTRFTNIAFRRVGGYHNDYYHRAEDNEIMFNLKRLSIHVVNNFGIFNMQPHERKEPEFNPALWHKAQIKREVQDQLSICRYEVLHTKEIDDHIRHIVVSI